MNQNTATCFSCSCILAVAVLTMSLGGCSREPQFEVFVTPGSVVPAGGDAFVGVRVTNPPQGLKLHASAERGLCDPKEGVQLSSRYVAPPDAGNDKVTLEVHHGDKILFSGSLLLKILPPGSGSPPPAPPRAITIVTVPPYSKLGGPETSASIGGKTSGVDPYTFRVVVYVFTDYWYVQPLIANPFTGIAPDGSWSTWTHTGIRYAALVVSREFKPSARISVLPSLGDDVVAIAIVESRR